MIEQVQNKKGRTWEVVRTVSSPVTIYDNLAHDLIEKKINQCKTIRSITRRQNYDGTITITVTYYNPVKQIADVRAVYVIPENCRY